MPDQPFPPGCSNIAALLRSRRFNFATERDLQDAMANAFSNQGWAFQREFRLGDAGRVDFFFPARIALEVKTKGSLSSVKRQLFHYAMHPEVAELMLVTSEGRHADMPKQLDGKPLLVVVLPGGLA